LTIIEFLFKMVYTSMGITVYVVEVMTAELAAPGLPFV
jgi:hypothetical protein